MERAVGAAALVLLLAVLAVSASSPKTPAATTTWMVLALASALALVERNRARVVFACAALALVVGVSYFMAHPVNSQRECPLPTDDPACPIDIAAAHKSVEARLETSKLLQYHQLAAAERLRALEDDGVLTRMERLKRSREIQVEARDRLCAHLHAVEVIASCIPEKGIIEARRMSDAIKRMADRSIFAIDEEIHSQPNIEHLLDMRTQVVALLCAVFAWAGHRVDWRIA